MTTQRQPLDRGQEEAAARLQRRLEREEHRRMKRRRHAVIAALAALAGVVVLGGAIAALGHSKVTSPAVAGGVSQAPGARTIPATLAEPAPTAAETTGPAPGTPASAPPASVPSAKFAAQAPRKSKPAPAASVKRAGPAQVQHYTIRIGDSGYVPSVVSASSRSSISLTVGKGEGCAAGFLMPSLGIDKDNSRGSVTFSLGRLRPGTYRFSCGMDMVQGRLIVR